MESLRAQLAETQGALTERDKKFRQLRADHLQAATSWADEKKELEAKIARLESENLRLLRTPPTAVGEPIQPVTPTHRRVKSPEGTPTRKSIGHRQVWKDDVSADADGDDTVTITRTRMKQAEAQFEKMVEELAEKTRWCDALQTRLAYLKSTPVLELSDDEVVKRWNLLRERIRTLTLERLNKTISSRLVSDKCKDEFKLLSPHWKTYTSMPDMTCYLFRALIWRYLLRFFDVFCRACGRDISRKVGEVAAVLSTKTPEAEYQDWRIRTATLLHKICPIDMSLVDEITTKIFEAITPLATDTDHVALKVALHEIVKMTSELSALFDRSNFVVLMYSEPGSTLTHGFPYADKLMDMRGKLGGQGVVDMMITPSLLKKEDDYSVLVKADVVC
ncbi:hypothetical protein F5Y19DRAFT_350769 [Xylariaceae sp. FL1651]|nr:hypothetical protein F5Y19DRAFT_350769 [Xylariaceae sp. FL1651]